MKKKLLAHRVEMDEYNNASVEGIYDVYLALQTIY